MQQYTTELMRFWKDQQPIIESTGSYDDAVVYAESFEGREQTILMAAAFRQHRPPWLGAPGATLPHPFVLAYGEPFDATATEICDDVLARYLGLSEIPGYPWHGEDAAGLDQAWLEIKPIFDYAWARAANSLPRNVPYADFETASRERTAPESYWIPVEANPVDGIRESLDAARGDSVLAVRFGHLIEAVEALTRIISK